ncbi:MAG TPA: pilus assembly protein [Candidatus Yaniella excrementavium]|nr:pilus assembly protein [Candidatus Yaniella excrementavium]
MIIALITVLCATILQFGVIIHTRNTMIDAASAGARFAALADRSMAEGEQRTVALLTNSIPRADTADVTISREAGGELITVTIDHQLPVFGFMTGPVPLSTTAQAYDLTP